MCQAGVYAKTSIRDLDYDENGELWLLCAVIYDYGVSYWAGLNLLSHITDRIVFPVDRRSLGAVYILQKMAENSAGGEFRHLVKCGPPGACGKYRELTKTTENYRKQPKTTENLPKTTEINLKFSKKLLRK